MRKRIIRYVFILFILLFPNIVNAECSSDEITRLSKLAHNINTSVQFDDISKDFSITFLNLTNDFLIQNDNTGEVYTSYFELVLDHLDPGSYNFSIHDTTGCYEDEIVTKNIYVPYYNSYYNNKECQTIRNYVYCSKWLKSDVSYSTWKNKVDSYIKIDKSVKFNEEEEDKNTKNYVAEFFITLYVEHYYIFLPIIILSFTAIIYLKNKSDQIIYRKNKGEDITF